MKKWFVILLIFLSSLQAYAFEEIVVSTDAKLTDIKIKDNSIVNVYPLVTILNEKNILFFQPLNTGSTEVCVLKNDKDIVVFNVEVKENKTIVDQVKDFDILALDLPPEMFEVDMPPVINTVKEAE